MSVADLLTEVQALGGILVIDHGRLIADVPDGFPDAIVQDLREHRAEIQAELAKRRYRLVYPHPDQREDELRELMRRVGEEGYVLLWCTALDDLVAFHRSDVDPSKIPAGFVPYSDEELWHLFSEGGAQPSAHALRLIHAAKQAGAVITSSGEDEELGVPR